MASPETVAAGVAVGAGAGFSSVLTVVLVRYHNRAQELAQDQWVQIWTAARQEAADAREDAARANRQTAEMREENGFLRADLDRVGHENRTLRQDLDRALRELDRLRSRVEGIVKPWDGQERRRDWPPRGEDKIG